MKKSLLLSRSTIVHPNNYRWTLRQYVIIGLFWVQKWRRNAKTRKQLANLPVYLLRDIGLTEEQVRHEIRKKFWQ